MYYTVHGILQAKILEWVAVPFSRGFSQPRDWTHVSCVAGGFFTSEATVGVKQCLALYVIRKFQIKTTMNYHFNNELSLQYPLEWPKSRVLIAPHTGAEESSDNFFFFLAVITFIHCCWKYKIAQPLWQFFTEINIFIWVTQKSCSLVFTQTNWELMFTQKPKYRWLWQLYS